MTLLLTSASEIFNEILILKAYIEKRVPVVLFPLSCPILRFDNKRTNNTLRELVILFQNFKNIVCNDNVDFSCLGKRGVASESQGFKSLSSQLHIGNAASLTKFVLFNVLLLKIVSLR